MIDDIEGLGITQETEYLDPYFALLVDRCIQGNPEPHQVGILNPDFRTTDGGGSVQYHARGTR